GGALLMAGTAWLAAPVIMWHKRGPTQVSPAAPAGSHHPHRAGIRVRHRVIRLPIAQSLLSGGLWAGCGTAVVWLASDSSAGMAVIATLAVLLGGIASAALTYFEAERFL